MFPVKDFTRKLSLILRLNLFIGLTVNLEAQIYRLKQNTGGHLVATKIVFTSVLLLLYLTNILVRCYTKLGQTYSSLTIQLEINISRGSASCFYQGSRLLLVNRRKFGSSRAYMDILLSSTFEAFSHCSSAINSQFLVDSHPTFLQAGY
jgi:hypothetical protein